MVLRNRGPPYARLHRCNPPVRTPRTLEQGEIDRREAAASAKARLVYPQQVANRRPNTRPGHVQSSYRQQAPRIDVVRLKVEDVAPHGHAVDRATVRQKKTGQPVRFEM